MGSYGGRGPKVNAALWTETVIAAGFAVLRIYTRKFVLKSFGWDDFFLLLTLILFALYAAMISIATSYGLGQKRADISPDDYMMAMKYEIIGQAICIFNIFTSKSAVAFFLLRIVVKMRHRVFIWICVISTLIITTWCTIAVFIQCIPVVKVWNPYVEGECWLDFSKVGITTSAFAVAIDFILAISPCFIVWELNMKRKDKLLAVFGLSLGVFAGVCGILRTTSLTSLRSYNEYIYDTVDMLIYSGTENFVSVICASIPVLRPLWVRVRGYESNDDSYQRSYKMGRLGSSQDPESAIRKENATRCNNGSNYNNYAAKIFSGGRDITETTTNDNASEETILRETRDNRDARSSKGASPSTQVFCQTDICIDYSRKD